MNKVKAVWSVIVILSFIASSPAFSQAWKKYPYHKKGTAVLFPADEGSHGHIPGLEWWYTVIHAVGKETGERYSILVCHFNNSVRFFTVTNIDRDEHQSSTAFGVLNSAPLTFELSHSTVYGIDLFRSKRDIWGRELPFEYEMRSHGEGIRLEADLSSLKPPFFPVDTGLMEVGSSGATWYYSHTRLAVNGRLSFKGIEEEIEGSAWMDHQWGPFVVSPVEGRRFFETYEWLCLQLDNGEEIMISNIFDRNYQIPLDDVRYGGVGIIRADGTQTWTTKREFTRMTYHKDPVSGTYISSSWQLKVPEWNLSLYMKPDLLNQMVHFPMGGSFFEGSFKIEGEMDGRPVKGKGFAELIHRFEIPKLNLEELKESYAVGENIPLKVKVLNPDDGNPLRWDLHVYSKSRGRLMSFYDFNGPIEYSYNHQFYRGMMKDGPLKFEFEVGSRDFTIKNKIATDWISLTE